MTVEPTQDAQPRVACTADADGRIVFDLPPSAPLEGRLLLRLRPKKGEPETLLHHLDLGAAAAGGRRAVLAPHTVLEEGRWDVYLLSGPDATRHRLRPGPRDLRALVDGHLRDRRSPLAVRVPYATRGGHLAVRAWLRPAHAEVERVDVTDRTTTVSARLHGAALRETAVVRLRRRGGGAVERALEPRSGDGDRFSFTVEHAELVAESAAGPGGDKDVWDVFVRPAADAPVVRVARLLDDLADRKEVYVYPTVTVGGAAVRPYYTNDNDLSVEVKRPV
ncbi:transferase [Streptomyces sp. NPDC005574]|uniref:transferase n=1 Tax=Streptomyces sp. NPDC005574 TaxID=3156891 RepID=UPI0033AF56D8